MFNVVIYNFNQNSYKLFILDNPLFTIVNIQNKALKI